MEAFAFVIFSPSFIQVFPLICHPYVDSFCCQLTNCVSPLQPHHTKLQIHIWVCCLYSTFCISPPEQPSQPTPVCIQGSHSTETVLIAVTEELHTARAASLSSVVILLDLSAAFDTVNHQILLSTLQELGVSGFTLSLFPPQDCTYRVIWRESVSEPCSLTTGVPQGSVLGPLLFSLYTKSLSSVIYSHGFSSHSYAVDTQFILSLPQSETQEAAQISWLMHVWLTCLCGCLHTTWSSFSTRPSCSSFQGRHLPSHPATAAHPEGPVTAQQKHDCLLSLLHNGGTNSPLTSRAAEVLHIFCRTLAHESYCVAW